MNMYFLLKKLLLRFFCLLISMSGAGASVGTNLHDDAKHGVTGAVPICTPCSVEKDQPKLLCALLASSKEAGPVYEISRSQGPLKTPTVNTEPDDGGKHTKLLCSLVPSYLNAFSSDWSFLLSSLLSLRPVCCNPIGLSLLSTTGLFTGHYERVQWVRLVAVLVPVLLRAHRPAASPGHRPPQWRLHVSGHPLLPVRISRLRHLPPGHRVPGPRYGNLTNALPLKKTTPRHEPMGIIYLLKSFQSQLVGTRHKCYRFLVNSRC